MLSILCAKNSAFFLFFIFFTKKTYKFDRFYKTYTNFRRLFIRLLAKEVFKNTLSEHV